MANNDNVLIFAHIGDLHLTIEDQANYRDFQAIISEIIRDLADTIDFIYLPGDNADNGLPEQYALVQRELARLPIPVHIVTGDHDMEPGQLDNFYGSLGAEPLPKAVVVRDVCCLFLDICGPGRGGLDFRIGASQREWLTAQLKKASELSMRCAIFMHTYPADLCGDGETAAINTAFAAREVLLVDMGHTHYNELANDGYTIFSATRSTGQIEEGPVGYSLIAIDRRTVSWRFKELGSARPIVLITAPADRRLATDAGDPDHLPNNTCEVRATVLHERQIKRCTCRLDNGPELTMTAVRRGRYTLIVALHEGASTLVVTAESDEGCVGSESIEIATAPNFDVKRYADGSDADAIGEWEQRGIMGTQLGPNRNGKKW